jgi:hypothetical protein
VMPALPGGGFADLFTNRVFLAGFWAWFCAQTLKVRRTHKQQQQQQPYTHMYSWLACGGITDYSSNRKMLLPACRHQQHMGPRGWRCCQGPLMWWQADPLQG